MITLSRALFVNHVVRQTTTVAMMWGLTYLGLSIQEIGNFEALKYLLYVVTMAWMSASSVAYLKLFKVEGQSQQVFSIYLFFLLGGCSLLVLVTGLFPNFFADLLLNIGVVNYAIPFTVYALGYILGDGVIALLSARKAAKSVLFFTFFANISLFFLFLLPLYLGYGMSVAIWGLAFNGLVRSIWFLIEAKGQLKLLIPKRSLWIQYRSLVFNLGLLAFVGLFMVIVDHGLVTYFSSDPDRSLSLWKYGAIELPFIAGIAGIVTNVTLVNSGGDVLKIANDLKQKGVMVATAVLLLACVLMTLNQYLFAFVFGNDFMPSHVIFNTLLLALPTRLIFTTPLILTKELEGQMTKAGVLETILNIIFSLVFYYLFGVVGIALGTVVALYFERCYYMYILSKHDIYPQQYTNIGQLAFGVVLLFVLYLNCTQFDVLM